MGGVSIVFKVEGDKVTGFTITPPQGNPVSTRAWRESESCGASALTPACVVAGDRFAVGAALAVVSRRERGRRRRRQADGREVERSRRRERRVEDAGPRRRRLQPDCLGRSRVRVDRDQQRSRTRASARACTATSNRSKTRRSTRGVCSRSTRNRQGLWDKVAYEGVPKTKRHPKSSQASATPVTDGKSRRRLVRIGRSLRVTTSTASCSGRKISAS